MFYYHSAPLDTQKLERRVSLQKKINIVVSSGVLLDRQVVRHDHGGHQGARGQDQGGAGRREVKRRDQRHQRRRKLA